MKFIWICLLSLCLSPFAAHARESANILISDIDDTLKISHVGSPLASAVSAFGTRAFPGMRDIYWELADKNPGLKIYYVSRAPRELLEKKHRNFLEVNGFPAGELHLPKIAERNQYKINEISSILDEATPGLVLLVGDNTESDPEVYREIKARYESKGFTFRIFIHLITPEVRGPSPIVRYNDANELAAALTSMELI